MKRFLLLLDEDKIPLFYIKKAPLFKGKITRWHCVRRLVILCWRCRLVDEGIDARRAGIVGEISQSRLNASAAADAAGGSDVVW